MFYWRVIRKTSNHNVYTIPNGINMYSQSILNLFIFCCCFVDNFDCCEWYLSRLITMGKWGKRKKPMREEQKVYVCTTCRMTVNSLMKWNMHVNIKCTNEEFLENVIQKIMFNMHMTIDKDVQEHNQVERTAEIEISEVEKLIQDFKLRGYSIPSNVKKFIMRVRWKVI